MLRQTLPVDEIVVVADSCTDNTVEVASSYGAIVVETEQGAKAASQDVGLPHVTGDVLVCIDADAVPNDFVRPRRLALGASGQDNAVFVGVDGSLRSIAEVELREDSSHMRLDGSFADVEL